MIRDFATGFRETGDLWEWGSEETWRKFRSPDFNQHLKAAILGIDV